jgi:hypothetical protein
LLQITGIGREIFAKLSKFEVFYDEKILTAFISVVDPDPTLFAGSRVGSGINLFGSGSGQFLSRMNLKQNFITSP